MLIFGFSHGVCSTELPDVAHFRSAYCLVKDKRLRKCVILGSSATLFGDGERARCNRFLHSGSVEDAGNNYGASILTSLTTWRLLFPYGDIKTEMVSST